MSWRWSLPISLFNPDVPNRDRAGMWQLWLRNGHPQVAPLCCCLVDSVMGLRMLSALTGHPSRVHHQLGRFISLLAHAANEEAAAGAIHPLQPFVPPTAQRLSEAQGGVDFVEALAKASLPTLEVSEVRNPRSPHPGLIFGRESLSIPKQRRSLNADPFLGSSLPSIPDIT